MNLCSHAFSVFQLKQGSVATLIRWRRWNLYRHVCCSFLNLSSCMHAGGRRFEHMLQNYCFFVLCGSSEHYETVNVIWW